jgi:hypothetical protein
MTGENGDRVAALEEQMQLMAWLLAETRHQNLLLAKGVAALLAQRLKPAVEQQILSQLMGG